MLIVQHLCLAVVFFITIRCTYTRKQAWSCMIVLLLDWVDARILYFHSSRPIVSFSLRGLVSYLMSQCRFRLFCAAKLVVWMLLSCRPIHVLQDMTWRHYPVQSVYPPPALTSTPVPRLTDRLLVVRQLLQAFQPLLRRYAHPWSPSQASRTLLVHGEPVWQWRLSFRWSERLDVTISKSRGDVMWNIRRGRSCAISKKGVFVNVCIDKRSWLYQGSDTIPTIRTCPCKYTQSIDPSTTSHTGH
ncbi:hypothetical protein KCU98_g232, partial [Aureobasidium melanogenum]